MVIWHDFDASSNKQKRRAEDTPETASKAQRAKNAAQQRNRRALLIEQESEDIAQLQEGACKQYYESIDLSLSRTVCNCCGLFVPSTQISKVIPANSDLLKPLVWADNEAPLLVYCEDDKRDFARLCDKCEASLSKKKVPNAAIANGLFFGDIPDCLKQLNDMEKRMIARVCCFVSIHLPRYSRQLHTRGHAINLVNQPGDIARKLPRVPDESGIVIVRPSSNSAYAGLREFVVRPHYLRAALVWLKANNKLYSDVEIDEPLLSKLEFEGEVDPPHLVVPDEEIPSYTGSHQDAEEQDPLGPPLETALIDCDKQEGTINDILANLLPGSNAPRTTTSSNTASSNTVPAAAHSSTLPPTFELPPFTTTINEYSTTSYVGMAFPWLFPYGRGLPDDIRPVPLSLPEYFRYLVHYHDRRFATNPLFVFWATNTLQRSQATKVLKIASDKLEGGRLSAGLLRQAAAAARGDKSVTQEAQQLLGSLVPYFDAVKDSAPFWKARKKELLSMMSSSALRIKTPTWFVTFSPADAFWPELFKLVDPTLVGEKLHSLSKDQRQQVIADNPDLAILCFQARFEAILKVVLGPLHPLGKITDWYWKVEYQGRGSPHIHAIFWADLGCDIETLLRTEDGLAKLAKIIEIYSVAIVPGETQSPDEPLAKPILHPAFFRKEDPISTAEGLADLRELVVCCQLHSHKPTCYKKSRQQCRFNFPFEATDHTRIIVEENGALHKMQVLYKRNHRWINCYSPLLLWLWRGNMDCSFIANPYGVAYYAAAYAAKGEPSRIAFRDSLTRRLARLGDNATLRSRLQAVAFASLGAREMSLQECLWILCGYKCTDISRTFVSINISKPELRNQVIRPARDLAELEDNASDVVMNSTTTKFTTAYIARPAEMQQLTLSEFVSKFQPDSAPTKRTTLKRYKLLDDSWISERKQLAVVLFYPQIAFDCFDEESAYGILMAHVPWRKLEDLLRGRQSAVEALSELLPTLSAEHREHISINSRDYAVRQAARAQRGRENQHNQEARDTSTVDDSNPANASAFLPLNVAQELVFEEAVINQNSSETRGNTFSPRSNYTNVDITKAQTFVKDLLKEHETERQRKLSQLNINSSLNNNQQSAERAQRLQEGISKLNSDQLCAYKIIEHHIKSQKQLMMALIGGAGTGKSFLIDVVEQLILFCYGNTGGLWGSVVKTAFTGIAAYNIGGVTISSVFHMGTSTKPPGQKTVLLLQRELDGLRFLIIDEVSMLSHKHLQQIDMRLRKAFPLHANEPFGGVHILFVGDFFQIPPVNSHGLYKPMDSAGRDLWLSVPYCIMLNIQQRQQDGDPLGNICNRARTGDVTTEDIRILNTRFLPAALPPDAVFTSPTNNAVKQLNDTKLAQLHLPEVTCWARHTPSIASAAGIIMDSLLTYHSSLLSGPSEKDDRFRGLYNYITLAVGARVMLLYNVATPLGLVNGATGVVYDFIYNPLAGAVMPHASLSEASANPYLQLPIVLVQFDAAFYSGPSFIQGVDRVVPISAIEQSAKFGRNANIVRHQLPLCLAWGLTVHKVQGLTLGKVIAHLPKVHDRGLAYVAISRVKKLENLFLQCPLPPNIFSMFAADLAQVKTENARLSALDQQTRAMFSHLM